MTSNEFFDENMFPRKKCEHLLDDVFNLFLCEARQVTDVKRLVVTIDVRRIKEIVSVEMYFRGELTI